nr:hydroxymethylglutaryl-CoA synthase-like [Ipomoea batatas]
MLLNFLHLQVGTISVNGKRENGELIAKAMKKVGKKDEVDVVGLLVPFASCLTAVTSLLEKDEVDPKQIGRLEVGSEIRYRQKKINQDISNTNI